MSSKQALKRWTAEEDAWLIANYANRLISLEDALPGRTHRSLIHRAKILGLKRPIGRLKGCSGRKRQLNEEAVCRSYRELGTLRDVAIAFGACDAVISRVLHSNGIMPQAGTPSRLEPRKEEVIADFLHGTMPLIAMAVKYGVSDDAIRGQLIKWGVYNPKRKDAFMNRKSPHECWLVRYGQEEADRRWEEMCSNRAKSTPRGKDSPLYGKPSRKGTGNGWKGWYRGHYFRSLREACFMIQMDKEKTHWVNGETLCIPYLFNGNERTYRPDYVIGTRLIEIKPTKLHNSPQVTAKYEAAKAYCAARGLTYELIDVVIEAQSIAAALRDGLLRFDRDYEARFLAYIATHKPTGC